MSILAIVLAATAVAASAPAAAPLDCKAARIELLRTLQPLVNPDATLFTPEDDDPTTVQFFFVAELKASEGRVSQNGQVIYLPRTSGEDREAGQLRGARLFAQAIDILLAQRVGNRCEPLQVDQPVPNSRR